MAAVDIGELYSVPPEEFVATRSKIVAALKAEKRKDDAAAIQKLRRPRLAEHALNSAARAQPATVERWAAAVAAMDAAQSQAIGGGGGAAALREAAGELRRVQHSVSPHLEMTALADRVLRTAWTIADLTGLGSPGREEIGQALAAARPDVRLELLAGLNHDLAWAPAAQEAQRVWLDAVLQPSQRQTPAGI